jgi:hypothetical protein
VRRWAVVVLLATACSGGGGAAAPGESPTVQLPAPGVVNRPLCLALRAGIQGNVATVAADRAAGNAAAAAQVQARVDADVVRARRIKDCSVDDLLQP